MVEAVELTTPAYESTMFRTSGVFPYVSKAGNWQIHQVEERSPPTLFHELILSQFVEVLDSKVWNDNANAQTDDCVQYDGYVCHQNHTG